MRVTILTHSYGNAGSHVSGPGMCLVNFVKYLREYGDFEVDVFTHLPTKFSGASNTLSQHKINYSIRTSDVIHHWSGTGIPSFVNGIQLANALRKKVILGPNLIDTVHAKSERVYLDLVKFDTLLTVNERLKYLIADKYNIPQKKIGKLLVGPDLKLWAPSSKDNGKILWKGNSKHFVKDMEFGREVARNLPYFEFDFMDGYEYYQHVDKAKDYHLYFSTSLSETMGLGLAEQLAAGVPSVTHPKIYLHGENYKTGIITSRTIDDYCEAITEIMQGDSLHGSLSSGARQYMLDNFSEQKIVANYLNIL
jgi:glycosyltransferase involved in cell wall biosynthesis